MLACAVLEAILPESLVRHTRLLEKRAIVNYRSALAMRQRAQQCGASVAPVALHATSRGCHIASVCPDEALCSQLLTQEAALQQQDNDATQPLVCTQHSMSAKQHWQHLLVLPGECNVTGVRPAAATLHSLCQGSSTIALDLQAQHKV